jgi:RNA polymerase sigma-70 factor (ECF subfamily)
VESPEFQQALRSCAARLTTSPKTALADLFDLTAQRLVRFASTVAGNQADAEDALQAVFSLLARHPRLLASAKLPWPYLLRSIRNEALRIARRRGGTGHLTTDPGSSGDSDNPAIQVAIEETGDCVRRVLQSLPPEQLEVVVLKHWEELTFAEIAESLNLSQNTVASRYRYAIEKLQRSLEPFSR